VKRLLLIPLAIVLLVAVSVGWFYENTLPVSGDKSFKNFVVDKGSSAGVVGNKLVGAGLIRSAIAFKIYIQFTGLSGSIQAGEFQISPSSSIPEVVSTFLKGPVELWVTIPEGLRREEIAGKFSSVLSKDQTFENEFLKASTGEEGYLFPDTYLFPKDVTASVVVAKMKATFDLKTAALKPSKDQVILASLIERETKGSAERPIVAGIILKRLKAGWALQIDATLQYGLGTAKNWWPILTRDDIAANTPYNSYKFPGFPPTPIANAGLSSIQAAVNPQDSDYWYYIHSSDGVIHYAKTLEEHNSNIRKYLTR